MCDMYVQRALLAEVLAGVVRHTHTNAHTYTDTQARTYTNVYKLSSHTNKLTYTAGASIALRRMLHAYTHTRTNIHIHTQSHTQIHTTFLNNEEKSSCYLPPPPPPPPIPTPIIHD